MSTIHKIEGVVLQEFPFKEHDRILTLFTPQGVLKFFVKGRGIRTRALTSPLTIGEFLYTQGRSDLLQFRDGTVLEQNLPIRERLESLEAAQKLMQALLHSQWAGKPAPQLYRLFRHFLIHVGRVEHPQRLVSAFFIKTLKYEGILQLETTCTMCEREAEKRFGGERYCTAHAPSLAETLTLDEERLLQTLSESRSLEEIASLPQEEEFAQKVEKLFEQGFRG